MEPRIVPAQAAHVSACADCLTASAIETPYFSDLQFTRSLIAKGVDKSELHVCLDSRDAVQGFYWANAAGMFCRFPYLRLLAVRREYRGRGVGARLLAHFEKNGFERAPKVFLTVSDFNNGAQRFYTRSGYVCVGTINDLYKKGIAEILMMKSSDAAGKL